LDLLCGASSLLGRLQRIVAVNEVSALVRPALAELCRVTHPDLVVNDLSGLRPGPLLLVNARWLPLDARLPAFTNSVMGLHGDSVAYVYLDAPEVPDDLPADLDACLPNWKRSLPGREAGGWMIDYPWDLIEANGPALAQDFVA